MIKFCMKCNAETERAKNDQCKQCKVIADKAYRAANQEKIKALNRAYYKANTERINVASKAWAIANPEKRKAAVLTYYEANKGKAMAATMSWQAANQDKVKAAKLAWRAENKDKIKWYGSAWRAANPESHRANEANRRAIKKASTGKHTAADIKSLYALQKGKCICCQANLKDGYHVDHIYPLINGGGNGKNDIQLLCPACNMSKGAKHPITFMQSRGFLI